MDSHEPPKAAKESIGGEVPIGADSHRSDGLPVYANESESGMVQKLRDGRPEEGQTALATESRNGKVLFLGASQTETGRAIPVTDIDAICENLRELQVRRKYCINVETKIMNTLGALCRRYVGHDSLAEDDEATREAQRTRADRIVAAGLKGRPQKPEDEEIATLLVKEFEVNALMLAPLWARRDEIEAAMDAEAKLLPAAPFTQLVPGFKLRGLAVIVGETGNFSNYATERKLWRRLGLGMAQGHERHAYSTWKRVGGLNAEDWTAAGYSPKRLGQIFGVVTTPLFMHKAKSKYGEVYAARRAHTAMTHPIGSAAECKADPTRWTKAHSDMDARRVMTKAFLADLWREWRGSTCPMEAANTLAPVNQSA